MRNSADANALEHQLMEREHRKRATQREGSATLPQCKPASTSTTATPTAAKDVQRQRHPPGSCHLLADLFIGGHLAEGVAGAVGEGDLGGKTACA